MSEQDKLFCPFCKNAAYKKASDYLCENPKCTIYDQRMPPNMWLKPHERNTRPQPALDSDVVERVADSVVQAVSDIDVDSVEGLEGWLLVKPEELRAIVFNSAIAAMQPAIDKAVAEERARCVKVCNDILSMNPVEPKLITIIKKAIEQGGGDA